MSKQNNYLYLIWKDPRSRSNFTIGKLTRGDKYTFEYCEGLADAESCGWNRMDAFSEDKVYESDVIFPVFASRLPDRKRRDIGKILEKYGLTQYDEFELLRKSGARLPIDTYEFIDPIFPEAETVECDFFVVGIRHNASCGGNHCELLPEVRPDDLLLLEEEPENKYDPNAIRVLTSKGEHLGYIPRYYNQAILQRLHRGITCSCRVLEVHPEQKCSDCVKARLNMPSASYNKK